MKNLKVVTFTLLFFFIFSDALVFAADYQTHTAYETTVKRGKKKKNGRYKKKKGLFKRKNDCDCPKH